MEQKLLSCNSSRTFTQMQLPYASSLGSAGEGAPMMPLQERLGPNANVAAPAPYRPDKLVRTDHKAQSLDTFLVRQANPSATAAAALGGMVARKRVREQRGVPLEFGGADGGEGGGRGRGRWCGPAARHARGAAVQEPDKRV